MYKNTWTDHLIAFLLSARSSKLYRQELWAMARARNKKLKKSAFDQYLYRLNKNKILEVDRGDILINRKQLAKLQLRQHPMIDRDCKISHKVLVSFDIPGGKNKTRDWLRSQLKYWEFKMIHQSLWLGFGPLPEGFKERLKDLEIDKNVRIFKIVRG